MSGFGARGRVGAGAAAVALSVSCLGLSYSAARKGVRGDEAYRRGDYEEALKSYSEALAEAPEEPRLFFNIGDVLYRRGSHPEAAKLFQRAAASGDSQLRAKSWYNAGNANYRVAAKGAEGKPPAGGAGGGFDAAALKEASACYVRALGYDPGDRDSKYNLELVQRLLKEQEQQQDQQQEQQQEQQQDQPERREEEEEREEEPRGGDGEDREPPESEQEERPNEEGPGEEEEKEQPEREEPGDAGEETEPAGEPARDGGEETPGGDMSEQEARQIVESLDREERDPTRLLRIEGAPPQTHADKDW
jgi:Ca-activated chloride channel family protein